MLALIHTIPANIETFDALVGELAPDIPIRHVMHDELLKEALAAGELTPDIRRRTAKAVVEEAENGAPSFCALARPWDRVPTTQPD